MRETSARLLRLLSLLQMRREWSGADLAERLQITTRTVRRDVEKLRDLGYPVDANVGVGGGYRLGAGAEMPPLLLDDDEVVAVALALRSGTNDAVTGIGDAETRALAKLRQVMPSRLQHRLAALSVDVVERSPVASAVDAELLATVTTVCHNHERLRFAYRTHDARRRGGRWSRTGSCAQDFAGIWSRGTSRATIGARSAWIAWSRRSPPARGSFHVNFRRGVLQNSSRAALRAAPRR